MGYLQKYNLPDGIAKKVWDDEQIYFRDLLNLIENKTQPKAKKNFPLAT